MEKGSSASGKKEQKRQWWQYQGRDFNAEESIGFHGFLYLIIFPNGKKYIGRRKFSTGWDYYCGSGRLCREYLKENGCNGIKREIIALVVKRSDLRIAERELIEKFNAVESDEYYNLSYGDFFVSESEEDGHGIGLSEEEIHLIFQLIHDGVFCSEIGKYLDMDSKMISKIISNPHFSNLRRNLKEDWNAERIKEYEAVLFQICGEEVYETRMDAKNSNVSFRAVMHGKINSKDIVEMIPMRIDGMFYSEIGEKFGINRRTVEKIFTRKSWTHVTDKFFNDPETAEKLKLGADKAAERRSIETGKKIKEREYEDTEEKRENRRRGQAKRNSKPGASEARSNSMKKVWEREEFQENHSRIMRGLWQDEDYVQKQHESRLISARKGEDKWNAVLKEKDINFIRQMRKDGLNNTEIARYFEVNKSAINPIFAKKPTWKHVKETDKEEWTNEQKEEYDRMLKEACEVNNITDLEDKLKNPYKGENSNSRTLLKNEDIPRILDMRLKGMSLESIGKEFGVGYHVIHNICIGKSWTHITDKFFEDPEFRKKMEEAKCKSNILIKERKDIEKIMRMRKDGMAYIRIGREFDVSGTVIRDVITRETKRLESLKEPETVVVDAIFEDE